MQHIISVWVENHFGVLARVASLFSGRGFNIDSLAVGVTQQPDISRMTIVVAGDDRVLQQVKKQLQRLVDVIKVQDFASEDHVDRELMLVKVTCDQATRSEIVQVVDIFRAKIVDVSPKALTIEVTGSEGKVEALLDFLRPFGIKEVVRTGRVAIARG